jgi:hypothetical protein
MIFQVQRAELQPLRGLRLALGVAIPLVAGIASGRRTSEHFLSLGGPRDHLHGYARIGRGASCAHRGHSAEDRGCSRAALRSPHEASVIEAIREVGLEPQVTAPHFGVFLMCPAGTEPEIRLRR